MRRSLFAKVASANRRARSKISLVSLGRSNFTSASPPVRRLAQPRHGADHTSSYSLLMGDLLQKSNCRPFERLLGKSEARLLARAPGPWDNKRGWPRLRPSKGKSMRPHLALASLIIIALSLGGLFAAAIWEW